MLKWERLQADAASVTQRLRVPGGWVYLVTTANNGGVSSALCFIPLTGKPDEDKLNDEEKPNA
jgi:hypothetical protein